MKKILLSLLMLCTMVSAWSQTTQTVTITYGGTNDSPFTVQGTPSYEPSVGDYWLVRSGNPLKLKAKQGYYITRVEFGTIGSNSNVDECDQLNQQGKTWVRSSGDTKYYDVITFSNFESDITKVTAVTVTYYHVCYGATHHEAVAGTCTTPGRADYWECVCGKMYSDADCTNEVTDMATLATETDPTNHANGLQECQRVEPTCCATGIEHHWHCADCGQDFSDAEGTTQMTNLTLSVDPTKHAVALTKHEAVAATCVSTGNVAYWECSACGHRFADADGKTSIADVTTDIDPTNHASALTEVASKNASVVEEGVYHHWHCQACGNDYADADGTEDMTGQTVMARYDADAILIGMSKGVDIDDSFLLLSATEETVTVATVTFGEDDALILDIAGKGGETVLYSLSEEKPLETSFAHTFRLTANQDPAKTDDYYSTFYTSEGAYKVPATAKAYIGEVTKGEDIDVLNLTATADGLIPAGEAVILRATESDVLLMPSCRKDAASEDNMLLGSDSPMTLPDNSYALSLGQHGVGFYDFSGYTLPAHKAYLTLAAASAGLRFSFGDATDIDVPVTATPANAYNLQGQRVDKNYRGIVIINGKKSYNN